MATYSIKWLKNILGTKFFPITHVKAVRDDNNTNLETLLSGKQQTLVSGSTIKTINGESVLGSGNISVSGGGGGGDVNVIESISVNGTAQAVDANKNVDITVPDSLSDLTADSTHRTVTDTEKTTWNNKQAAINDLSDIRSGAALGATALQSESDPVFSASAAAGISDTDITNWNNKTSNIGTITGITMNGSSKGTSGVVNLGTVITAHQDISGKADKSATVSSVDYNTTSKKITKTINGTTTDVVTAAKIVTDGGGITTETDPTVPSWAKESSKPSYTASEIGAVPTTRKVNGKALSADITLSASDVSALPSSTAIPSKTSDLTNDSGFLTSSDISGVYKYKGSKTNYSNLPTSGNVTGDVWNVVNAYSTYPAGTNFAWTGSAWDALGGAVDLSGYVPTSRTVNGKALSSNISLSASDVSALPSSTYIPTKTSDLTNDSDFITSADIPEGAAASSTTPLMDGTAAVGTETRFARGDHRHPSDTSKQDVISDLATIRSNASAGAAKVSNVQADWNASTGLAVILNKPTIPAEVTESTVAGWGFTKNTGTYSKPSTGIPKTDLANAVQTSLGKADTALQSYTETDPVFTASAAHGISSTDISNWNAKGTYSKPSGGIPKTDLASAVQTSLGKADTALQSYTETDPVFAASAAADITSSDITNWNSKTSNIGTITGINMNGASKGTSGVVDLGTVITAHQDISGKADKATTLAGYGITNAYTKTEDDSQFFALAGGTALSASSSNPLDLNTVKDSGSYYLSYSANAQYVSNKPTNVSEAFRVWVIYTVGTDNKYLRQRFQYWNYSTIYERTYADSVGWGGWVLIQDDFSTYAKASSLNNYYNLYGGTNLSPSSSNTINLNTVTDTGNYVCVSDTASQYVSNKPTDTNTAFRLWVSAPTGVSNTFRRQRFQFYNSSSVYERYTSNEGSSWYNWERVQANLDDTYLPLSGGTLTGSLNVATGNVGIGNTSPAYKLDVSGQGHFSHSTYDALHLTRSNGAFSTAICFNNSTDGLIGTLSVYGSSNSAGDEYDGVGTLRYKPKGGSKEFAVMHNGLQKFITGTVDGRYLILENTGWIAHRVSTTAAFSTAFCTQDENGNNLGGVCGCFGTNKAITNYFVGGTWSAPLMRIVRSTGNVGIGLGNTDPSQKLHVNGVVKCTSVDTSSDETLKDKVGDIKIKVEDIAAAPNVTFKWKEGEDTKNIHGGTYAQYWEKITPYYVHGEEGDKSLEYSPLAVSCSIQLAKEIVTLKEENAQLKKELAEIKEMVNKLIK